MQKKSLGGSSKTTLSPAMRSEIARQIRLGTSRAEEKKHSIQTFTDVNPAYPTSILSPTILDLRPTIPLGTGSQARLGQKIKLSNYKLSASMWMPSNCNVSPVLCRWIFFKLRGNPNSTPTLAQLNSMKRSNTQGVTTGTYTSTKTTQLCPYDEETFQILAVRDFKIGIAAAIASAANSTPNNDYSLERTLNIDMTSFLKHDILFDDSTGVGNVSVGDGLFCAVMCLDFQEQTHVASASTLRFDAAVVLDFTDA